VNTAVKIIGQTRITAQDIAGDKDENLILFLPELRVLFLLVIVFLSALGLVYIKDVNRQLFMQTQTAESDFLQSQVLHNKLLLEESSWSRQDRVQGLAQARHDMQILAAKDIVIVKKRLLPASS
jgi:cell division protein FtsL